MKLIFKPATKYEKRLIFYFFKHVLDLFCAFIDCIHRCIANVWIMISARSHLKTSSSQNLFIYIYVHSKFCHKNVSILGFIHNMWIACFKFAAYFQNIVCGGVLMGISYIVTMTPMDFLVVVLVWDESWEHEHQL